MWHQYYPFFVSFREKLRSGGSLQYLREAGMGIGYLPLYAYYLSSPLYLLSVLVPASLLREFFALLVLTKIGAGRSVLRCLPADDVPPGTSLRSCRFP